MNIEKLIDELNGILDQMEAFGDDEDVEELNATLEDVLFMLSESGEEDDFEDELEAAIEELMDIADGCRDIPEVEKFGDSIAAVANRMKIVLKNS